jgi:hypothetical protein
MLEDALFLIVRGDEDDVAFVMFSSCPVTLARELKDDTRTAPACVWTPLQ